MCSLRYCWISVYIKHCYKVLVWFPNSNNLIWNLDPNQTRKIIFFSCFRIAFLYSLRSYFKGHFCKTYGKIVRIARSVIAETKHALSLELEWNIYCWKYGKINAFPTFLKILQLASLELAGNIFFWKYGNIRLMYFQQS